MNVKHNLKPIYDTNSKVLILGSMPSEISREKKFYYANKTNRFWPIFENIFNTKFLSDQEKIQFLINHNIALWDVFKSVDIIKSSDNSIKNAKFNEIDELLLKSNISAIFCTGKVAYNALKSHFNLDVEVFYLPSPSSANASFSLEKLISEYKIILKYL